MFKIYLTEQPKQSQTVQKALTCLKERENFNSLLNEHKDFPKNSKIFKRALIVRRNAKKSTKKV